MYGLMKKSPRSLTLILIWIVFFGLTVSPRSRAAEEAQDSKTQIAKLQSEIETLKAENEVLKKENQSFRRIIEAGQKQSTVAPAPTNAVPSQTSQKGTGYWMTTSSRKRHNSSCRLYMTSHGKACGPADGIACKICGG
jgi:regulator of replication initiation timing